MKQLYFPELVLVIRSSKDYRYKDERDNRARRQECRDLEGEEADQVSGGGAGERHQHDLPDHTSRCAVNTSNNLSHLNAHAHTHLSTSVQINIIVLTSVQICIVLTGDILRVLLATDGANVRNSRS